jgi:protein-disulfide isomerase
MRITGAVVALTVSLLIIVTGCSRAISGAPQPDPRKPGVVVSKDGYGIVAGFDDAPVRVEIFTEPQCSRCAELQADFGDDISRYINSGRLKVTYRQLTFSDRSSGGYSARVSNALFLAADPASSATAFQAFVKRLYVNRAPSGEGPSDGAVADMAREAGLPAKVADRIAAGESAVDVKEMGDANFGYLFDANPLEAGTPTVYDPVHDQILDIYDNNWLSKLMASA